MRKCFLIYVIVFSASCQASLISFTESQAGQSRGAVNLAQPACGWSDARFSKAEIRSQAGCMVPKKTSQASRLFATRLKTM
jgi:hypothetical protein